MPSSQRSAGPHRADIDNVNLDDYNIHVIASVFKQWLRDLPNPLMTFELYEEFLRAMGKRWSFPTAAGWVETGYKEESLKSKSGET